MKFNHSIRYGLISLLWLIPSVSAAQPPAADIQFFGDTYLSYGSLKKTSSTLEDPRLLQKIKPLLSSSKLNVINFEGIAGASFVPFEMKNFLLRMNSSVPAMLAKVGVNAATLANNHAMDFGPMGLFETQVLLEDAGIKTNGAGVDLRHALAPLILNSGGKNICIRSFSRTLPQSFWAKEGKPGTASVSFTKTKELLSECKNLGFFTIAVFHWGAELMAHPKDYQRKLARLSIDGGADLVIGHHPHILQSVEIYKNRPIFYSIGNFAFASITKGRRQEGASVRVRFNSGKKSGFEVDALAINVNNDFVKYTPRLFSAKEKDPLARHMP